MKRVAVIGLETSKDELMNRLMDLEAVQLTDQSTKLMDELWALNTKTDDCQEEVSYYEQKTARASQALDVIGQYGGLKNPLFKTRRAVSPEEMQEIPGRELEAEDSIEALLVLNDRIKSRQEELNRIQQDILMLEPWSSYDVPLDGAETQNVVVLPCIFPIAADMDAVEKSVADVTDMAELREVNEDKLLRYAAVLIPKRHVEELQEALKEYGLQIPDFSLFSGTARDVIRAKNETGEKLRLEIEKIIEKVKEQAFLKEPIEDYIDILTVEADKLKSRSRLLKTGKTFFLEGWAPAARTQELRELLDDFGCYYEIRDPEEGEEVPVLLKNRKFFAPIEAVTEMYSLPAYGSVDPTSIFALWYICFFGMMFSDACYGIIMTLACGWALKKYDLEGTTYKMVKGFFYCGISTFFWGVMYGGWFGDFFEVFSRTVLNREIDIKPLWFDPLDDPLKLLIFSVALGVVHIFIGMGISAWMKIRDGKLIDAIFGEGSWYVTIIGCILWLAGGYLKLPIAGPAKWITIVGAIMLFIGGGLEKKGIGKITGGLGNLYDITSYMSDILSYSRILALGLATGVIAQVVNMMGSLFGGGVLGCIFLILVFIVGQVVNFAINVLGAFIHASRLQYVEFFGKFYVDGGEPFDPFRKKTKYIRLENRA